MRISRLGQIPARGDLVDSAGNTLEAGDQIFSYFQTAEAINVGRAVGLDAETNTQAGNPVGLNVTGVDTAHAGGGISAVVGGYQGVNISNPGQGDIVNLANSDGTDGDGGAATLAGRNAASGDYIEVLVYGSGHVITHGGSIDILAGDTLTAGTSGTVGHMIGVADLADGSLPAVLALGPHTGNDTGLIPAFFRCM